MNKSTFLSVFIALFFFSNVSMAQIDTIWSRAMGGSGDDPYGYGDGGKVSIDRNDKDEVFVTCNTTSDDYYVSENKGIMDVLVVKLNSDGDTLWAKTIGGEDRDIPRNILALDDGGCMVVGFSYSLTGDFPGHHGTADYSDAFIARLDSNGGLTWARQYGGSDDFVSGRDVLNAIITTSDGNYLAAGQSNSQDGDLSSSTSTFYAGWFLKIDGDGTILKSERLKSESHNERNTNVIKDIVELSDGSGFVTVGETRYYPPPWMYWMAKVDTSLKNKLWEKEYGCSYDNIASSIVEAEFGNLIFTGSVYNGRGDVTAPFLGGRLDIWVAKIDSTGNMLNQICYGGLGGEMSYDLSPDNKGNFLVSGSTYSDDSYAHGGDTNLVADFWLIDFDYNLDTLWTYKFGGRGAEVLSSIVPSIDGNSVFGAGRMDSDSGFVFAEFGKRDAWVGKVNNPAPRNAFMTCGDSVVLNATPNYPSDNASLSYIWSPNVAMDNNTAVHPIVSPISTTMYYVTISDGLSFSVIDSVNVTVGELVLNLGSDITTYCTDSVRLEGKINSNSDYVYSWAASNSISDTAIANPFVFPDTTTTYILTITTNSGCSASDEVTVLNNEPVEICVVANVNNKNKIIWEKPENASIDSFFVYRESNSVGVYEKIAAKAYGDFSYYDDAVDQSEKAYSYKLVSYTCGVETSYSQAHKTINLIGAFSNDTNWNLYWNVYEGIEVKSYKIFRGTGAADLVQIDAVSGSVLTYKDPKPLEGVAYYQIAVETGYVCNPYNIAGMGFSDIKSNMIIVERTSAYKHANTGNIIEELPLTTDIYYESFSDSILPSNITTIDFDQQSVYPSVSKYFTDAPWACLGNFFDSTDFFAFSTSWYSPSGKSDDWMITPKISLGGNAILSWKSFSYDSRFPEAYEVRVSTTGTNPSDFESILYSNNQEEGTFNTRVVNLSMYGLDNQDVYIAFRNVSYDKYFLFIDDIRVFQADSIVDVAMLSADIPEYVLMNQSVLVDGMLANYGANEINSLDINWQIDNGAVNTTSINAVTIQTYSEYTFSLTNAWTPASEGVYTYRIWASNINGNDDENNINDTISTIVMVSETFPVKKVLIEEATGAWCGFCPDGAVKMMDIIEHDTNAIGVAIHSGDGMAFSEGNDVISAFIGGFPSGLVDRKKFDDIASVEVDRFKWAEKVLERQSELVPVSVSATVDYTANVRLLKVNVKAKFFDALSGDLRLNCYIVEDSMSGTGDMYNQKNYYNQDDTHPMYGLGDPIEGYQHRHVLRKMLGGAWGTDGVIPNSVSAGEEYSHEYTVVLPQDYDDNKVSIVVLVQRYDEADEKNREIINAYEVQLLGKTNIDEHTGVKKFLVYPNPASDNVCLNLGIKNKEKVNIRVYDIAGKIMYDKSLGGSTPVKNYSHVINTSNLNNGMYIIEVIGENVIAHKKLLIAK